MPIKPWFIAFAENQENQRERALRVKGSYTKILSERKQRIEAGSIRLRRPRNRRMLSASNIHYEMSGSRAVNCTPVSGPSI
jgi:hypothetical protein